MAVDKVIAIINRLTFLANHACCEYKVYFLLRIRGVNVMLIMLINVDAPYKYKFYLFTDLLILSRPVKLLLTQIL